MVTAAEVASGASPVAVAGFSRGATGAGSSIFGGFSSTLGGAVGSTFLDLNNSPTREDSLRPTFTAVCLTSFLSYFFSSFCETVSFELYNLKIYAYSLFLRLLRLSSGRLPGSFGRCLHSWLPDKSMNTQIQCLSRTTYGSFAAAASAGGASSVLAGCSSPEAGSD